MNEFLYSVDISVLAYVNRGMANAVFDVVMPFLTDLNKLPFVRVLVVVLIVAGLVKGGERVRWGVVALIVTIVFSDQLNSTVIKHLFDRLRPCHDLPDVRLLVSCGSGYSFPSSHAVNNFAGAVVLGYYFPRTAWGWFMFAAVVALSRVYVGVHYPSDVIAGGVVGLACGCVVLALFIRLEAFVHSRRTRLPSGSP